MKQQLQILGLGGAILLLAACSDPPQERPESSIRTIPIQAFDTPPNQRVQAAPSRPVRTKVIPSPSPHLGQPIARPSGGAGSASRGRQMTADEAEEAARTIAETEPEGSSPCARAWSVSRDMQRAYRQKSPRARRGGDRASFMAGCRRMPRAMQECMNPQHYAENIDSCNRVRRRLGRLMPAPEWETQAPADDNEDTSEFGEERDPYDEMQDEDFY